MLYSIVIGNLDVVDAMLKYGVAPINTVGQWNGKTEKGAIMRGHLSLIQIAHDLAIEYGETHTVVIENKSRRAWIVEGESDLLAITRSEAHGHWTATHKRPEGNHTYIPTIAKYCEVK